MTSKAGLFAKLTLRPVAQIDAVPVLARPLMGQGGVKPRGLARYQLKLAKAAFRLVHQRLGIAAKGVFTLDPQGHPRRFEANFANTGYLAFANSSGGYEPEVSSLLQLLGPHAKTIYDIGANWGYFSLLLATLPQFTGCIEAFEIAPHTRHDLEALIAQGGLGHHVRVHGMGLSDKPGTVSIVVGMHSALTHVSADGHGHHVPVETLDRLALADPDLIKMDVEGHEAAILRGAAERLARAKPPIVFENWYGKDEPARMNEPLEILTRLGYRLLRMEWTAQSPMDMSGELSLTPITVDERGALPKDLNLVAVHPGNLTLFSHAFPDAQAMLG